ncbi:hypothetical protein M0R04_06980 [Candidatus Dojkabacteria bacterium]|jgi:hypothetical protein|nr:hypothetical protein [Candidatus Dojkabacteria bacterium]
MKLNEIAKQPVDWNLKSEKEQIAMVRRNGVNIEKIDNPSEAVQLAAVIDRGYVIKYIKNPLESVQLKVVNLRVHNIVCIKNPTQKVLLVALKNQEFIESQTIYDNFVKKQFANNTILMKKWLRYGEAMRES